MENCVEMKEGISEETEKVGKETLAALLPFKSKDRYEAECDIFETWIQEKKVNKINVTVLLAYFGKKFKKYYSSSLWSNYSIIKKILLARKDIDISKCHKLTSFLKNNRVGDESKKAMVLFKENVIQYLTEAPNEVYLMTKVALVFGIYKTCREVKYGNQDIKRQS